MYSVNVCSAIALCCGIVSGHESETECKTHLTSRLTEAFRKTVPGIQANCWIAAGSLFSLSCRQTQTVAQAILHVHFGVCEAVQPSHRVEGLDADAVLEGQVSEGIRQAQSPAYLLVEATSSHTLQNVNGEVVQCRFVVKLREQLA